jgi:anti-sigma-K factor RskA
MKHSREELLELAAAYAIGATTAEETAAVEAALATSPELAAEVASFREVVAAMSQAGSVAPSPATRARLLERVQNESAPQRTDARPSSLRPQWTTRGRITTVAAAIIIVASLAAESFLLAAHARRAETDRDVLERHLAHRESTLTMLLHAEKQLRVIHMKAADTVNGPGIQFFWNERDREGLVHAFRLPRVPENRAYQLWAIVDGRPESVKVFNSDPDGHALIEGLSLPTSSHGVTEMALTLEPSGGSASPTTEPMLKGSVATSY